jgi:hypothetical protein
MLFYISRILALLMLTVSSAETPAGERYLRAIEVFRCNFDTSCDANFDAWPDGWTRRRGPGYPSYVNIQIQSGPTPAGSHCLRVELDGGGAAVFTPPIPVEAVFSYMLEVYLRTEGLKHDQVYFSLTFLDSENHPLATYNSEKVVETQGWRKFHLGPIATPNKETHLAVIGLHVEPQAGEDLKGVIEFADVWLGRLPRMELKSNQAYNLFHTPAKVEATCTISGLVDRNPDVTFELLDVFGKILAREKQRLAESLGEAKNDPQADAEQPDTKKTFTVGWEPPLPGPGFYRIKVELKEGATVIQRQELTLALIQAQRPKAWGEFGWSLPQGNLPIPLAQLTALLGEAGINWVKYPFWGGEKENIDKLLDQYIAFGERLDAQGVELVGLLSDPPEELRELFDGQKPPSAAEIFSLDANLWYPSLEALLARLAGQVRWWQLGGDSDASFATCPDFVEKLQEIKKQFDRAAADIKLGIGWNWRNEFPGQSPEEKLPWQFVSLWTQPPLTAEELGEQLDATKDLTQKRWVVLEPLSRSSCSLAERVDNLVRRMIAAKIHEADAVFCPDPFDADHGLMNKDGTPGELFLPWRTTALELGGAKLLGSIKLPRGSQNLIFARANDALMVAWNDEPAEEVLYLGQEVKQIDLWGRTVEFDKRDRARAIHVDTLPTFVSGLSKPLAQWCISLALSKEQMASIFDQAQANGLQVDNPFPSDVNGTAAIAAPDGWLVEPKQFILSLGAGRQWQQPFSFIFPYTVESGRHTVRIDFDIQADRPYKFSVFKDIVVGLSDMHVELKTRLNRNNELVVEQRFVNQSAQPANFRCELYIPQRQLLKTQINNLVLGEDVQTYRLEDGKELLGQTLWLRAKQIDGPGVLNYRFLAEE